MAALSTSSGERAAFAWGRWWGERWAYLHHGPVDKVQCVDVETRNWQVPAQVDHDGMKTSFLPLWPFHAFRQSQAWAETLYMTKNPTDTRNPSQLWVWSLSEIKGTKIRGCTTALSRNFTSGCMNIKLSCYGRADPKIDNNSTEPQI